MQQAEQGRQTGKLGAVLEVSTALASQVRLDELLATIIGKTAEVLDAERATLFLYDAEREELWSKTADRLEIGEIRFPVSQGIAGQVARTRLAESIADVYADSRFNPEFDRLTGFRTRSLLSMPLIGRQAELIGVIQVLNKQGRAAFDREDESLLRGITAHVSVAIERASLIEAILEKDRTLEALNNARAKMIDHLSHELRTPLAVISASCTLLEKLAAATSPERARQIGERLRRAIGRLVDLQVEAADIAEQREFKEKALITAWLQRCRDLFQDVLDEQGETAGWQQRVAQRLAELYPDQVEQQAETMQLESWIPARLNGMRSNFAHRQIELELALEAGPGVCLPARVLFTSFRGLLRNAIEATPDGGWIRVAVRNDDAGARLEIQDSGVGIDAELQEQLFFGFVHAGATDNYSSGRPYDFGAGGQGLDLQRIKLFSERYGFQLSFSSTVGAGSIFALDFPPELLKPRDP